MSAYPNLLQLATGEIARVEAIHAPEALGQRLSALGFRVGGQVQVIRRAAFGGPLQIRLGTTDLIIRHRDAELIELRPQQPAHGGEVA